MPASSKSSSTVTHTSSVQALSLIILSISFIIDFLLIVFFSLILWCMSRLSARSVLLPAAEVSTGHPHPFWYVHINSECTILSRCISDNHRKNYSLNGQSRVFGSDNGNISINQQAERVGYMDIDFSKYPNKIKFAQFNIILSEIRVS